MREDIEQPELTIIYALLVELERQTGPRLNSPQDSAKNFQVISKDAGCRRSPIEGVCKFRTPVLQSFTVTPLPLSVSPLQLR